MLIAKVVDGTVLDIADYRSMFPNTSFPKGPTAQFLHENGCMKVSAFVDYDAATQKLESCEPYVDGIVVRTVKAVDKTAEDTARETEAEAVRVRASRDRLLAETDWMAIKAAETGVAMDAAWSTYRQQLRDITTQESFPEVVWPVSPDTPEESI